MSHTLFIADLHLSADRPDITKCFTDFLEHQAPAADALYILGDLFEYWLGDDDVSVFNTTVANAIRKVSDSGTPVFYIHGNRDFLIGKSFAKRAGMTLLPEQHVVDLYGTPTLIMHGDELCTRDVVYQKFRKKARGWWWPRLMLSLPLFVRRKIAEDGRRKSKIKQQGLTQEIMDVTPEEVDLAFERHGVSRMIHGHTHRPAVHEQQLGGRTVKRIVLGDWYEQGSVLVVDENVATLQTLNFSQ